MSTLKDQIAGAAQFAEAIITAREQQRPTIQLRLAPQFYDHKKQRYVGFRGMLRTLTVKAVPNEITQVDGVLRALVELIRLRGVKQVRHLLHVELAKEEGQAMTR